MLSKYGCGRPGPWPTSKRQCSNRQKCLFIAKVYRNKCNKKRMQRLGQEKNMMHCCEAAFCIPNLAILKLQAFQVTSELQGSAYRSVVDPPSFGSRVLALSLGFWFGSSTTQSETSGMSIEFPVQPGHWPMSRELRNQEPDKHTKCRSHSLTHNPHHQNATPPKF